MIKVSNILDPDQARRNVGPDQGPNCLQRSSAYDKTSCVQRNHSSVKQFKSSLICIQTVCKHYQLAPKLFSLWGNTPET